MEPAGSLLSRFFSLSLKGSFGLLFMFGMTATAHASTTTVFITSFSTSTWSVPADWNNASNTIEVIGAGAAGGSSGLGGGGGAYSKITNTTLVPGALIRVHIGIGGSLTGASGGDTYLCNATSNCSSLADSAVIVGAQGGQGDSGGGSGGSAVNGIGAVKYNGGDGGSAWDDASGEGASGGGGAAGPYGPGANGGTNAGVGGINGGRTLAGAGGGGADNGSPGDSAENQFDNNGGANRLGSGAGIGGSFATCNGTAGTHGGGGGGGGYSGCGGYKGGAGNEWNTSHGSGGGGGGGSENDNQGGGNGGLFGGGGGAAGPEGSQSAGFGAQGLIVVTYTPNVLITSGPTVSSISTSSVVVSWATGSQTSAQVLYGLTSSYGSTTDATDTSPLTTSHSVNVSSLSPGVTYHFAASSTDASGNTTLSGDSTFTTLSQYLLSITLAGSGSGSVSGGSINCGSTCNQNITQGDQITLTEIPSGGSTFIGWSGDCSGTSSTCTITANSDVSVTASFGAPVTQSQSSATPTPSSSVSSSGGRISLSALAALLIPSTSTTAYLNSLGFYGPSVQTSGCPIGYVCTPVTFSRNLEFGSTGQDVLALQEYLNTHSFIVSISGPGSPGHETSFFGSKTERALIEFQRAHGISPATGYFGPVTRNYVSKY